jgi:hypothetical protein
MIFQYIIERIRAAFAETPKPYWRPVLTYNWCVAQAEKGRRTRKYIYEK